MLLSLPGAAVEEVLLAPCNSAFVVLGAPSAPPAAAVLRLPLPAAASTSVKEIEAPLSSSELNDAELMLEGRPPPPPPSKDDSAESSPRLCCA